MSDPTLDQYVDRELLDSLQSIAASIFERHGVDFAVAQRAGGWSNAVWFADKMVLRLSTSMDNDRLLREAQLAAVFPPEVGYPIILDAGTTDGFAWTLAEMLPGRSLGEVWNGLDWEGRAVALRGLWERVQVVHTVPIVDLNLPRRAWFNSNNAEEADASLAQLAKDGIFSEGKSRVLRDNLNHFWDVVPGVPVVLCHGDLTLDNAVWHNGSVVSLLDFEFALQAPVHLDLNHLVKCAYSPEGTIFPTSIDDRKGAQRLRQVVAELAQPLLARPGGSDLLMGYAILLELWLMLLWLAHPEGEGPLEQWEPLRRLQSLSDGEGGYLAPLIQS